MTPSRSLPVSVVVPTIGRENLLRKCLLSILACEPPAAEVLVVDQSGSAVVQALAQEIRSSRLRVVRCDGRGVARATNLGLRCASHDVVLVTHDDCTVARGWVDVGHRLAAEVPGGLVTGRVLAPEGTAYVPATKDSTEPQDFTGYPGTGMLWPNNMVVFASAVAEIGGFDERNGLRVAEDTDFGYRWLCDGRAMRYEPELVVWHHDWRTPSQLVRTHVGYMRSMGVFFAKHLYARDPQIGPALQAYLRWAVPTFAKGMANRRTRWQYAERELFPHFFLGLVHGWVEARRLERAAANRTESDTGRAKAPTKSSTDGRARFSAAYSGAPIRSRWRRVKRQDERSDADTEEHPPQLMSTIRQSLGAARRRLLGLSGLDPHLTSLEAHSSAIEAQLASIVELVQSQQAHLGELSDKVEVVARARRDSQRVANYLSTAHFPVLHLGCGDMTRTGWLNTDADPINDDVIALDMREPYPFESESFMAVYTEHAIEHLDIGSAKEMLSHCHRVLKPLGVLRIATPDQRRIVELLSDDSQESHNYVRWACDQFKLGPPYTPALVINNFFREWGHQVIYDEPTLTALLHEVGFGDVRRMDIGHSQLPELDGAEMHGSLIGEDQNRIETMVLEATKPAK